MNSLDHAPSLCDRGDGYASGPNRALENARTCVRMQETLPFRIVDHYINLGQRWVSTKQESAHFVRQRGPSRYLPDSGTTRVSAHVSQVPFSGIPTSAFPKISTPSASLSEFMRISGVFPVFL